MAIEDDNRFNAFMDSLEANGVIFDQFLTGSEDTVIPVEGGELMTLKGIQKRLLEAELDANDFINEISDKMSAVSTPSESQSPEDQ